MRKKLDFKKLLKKYDFLKIVKNATIDKNMQK